MPKQVKAQRLGREGERWFAACLPADWLFQPPLEDVGVDGVVVICEDGHLNGTEFRVQIKASQRFRARSNMLQVAGLKRDAVLYWLTGFTPTLLVLYERSSKCGYCEWVNRLAAENERVLRGKSKTISLRVPVERRIDSEIWRTIRSELGLMNGLILRHVQAAGKALPLFRALHSLVEALHGFDFAANAKKEGEDLSGEDRKLLAQLEVACHRDVVRAVRDLDENFERSGYEIEGLKEFADLYESRCASFVDGFQQFVANPEGLTTLGINTAELLGRREGFTRSIVEAMRQLTSLGLKIRREGDDAEQYEGTG